MRENAKHSLNRVRRHQLFRRVTQRTEKGEKKNGLADLREPVIITLYNSKPIGIVENTDRLRYELAGRRFYLKPESRFADER